MLSKPQKVIQGSDFIFKIAINGLTASDIAEISVRFRKNSDKETLETLTEESGIDIDDDENYICKLPAAVTGDAQNDYYDIIITYEVDGSGDIIKSEVLKFIEIIPE